jgi:phospholipid transport system substrate-binding protein
MTRFNALHSILIFASSVILISGLVSHSALAIESTTPSNEPHLIVKQAADATFAKILAAKQAQTDNSEALVKIMEKELLPIVSYQFAAYKVLGNHARKLSKDEITEFVDVFRDYLLGNYASLLNQYDGQEVEFYPVALTQSSKEVSVRGELKNEDGPSVNFLFKMRKMRAGDWKVYDIIAEGISMVDTKRNEFSPIIRAEGIDVLIKKMREQDNA